MTSGDRDCVHAVCFPLVPVPLASSSLFRALARLLHATVRVHTHTPDAGSKSCGIKAASSKTGICLERGKHNSWVGIASLDKAAKLKEHTFLARYRQNTSAICICA